MHLNNSRAQQTNERLIIMLENFKVMEIVHATEPACVIIDDKQLRFTKPVITMLDYAPTTKLLMDEQGKQIAIQVTRSSDSNSFSFSKSKEEQKASVTFQNAVMVSLIRSMMPEWKLGEKFSVVGQYSKEDKAVIFDLKTAKPYWRRSPDKAK